MRRMHKQGQEGDPMTSGFSVTWILIVLAMLLLLIIIFAKKLNLDFLFG
ncbi:hypothetical protein GF367_02925 [Candidatus Woesearchaeota archaeon]|nr:hypothetical protein [Candidatus Woesearchaeota archaeon]